MKTIDKIDEMVGRAATPKGVTLEQWRAFVAVVEYGGFGAAAEQIGKSQSTVSHAVRRLEVQLGVTLVAPNGRGAAPTDAGRVLVQQARGLLRQAGRIAEAAGELAAGHEPEVRLVSDAVFPPRQVLAAVRDLERELKVPRIEVYDEVLSGAEDLLVRRAVDLAVVAHIPPGLLGDHLVSVPFVPVAAPDHPLSRSKVPVGVDELNRYRQVVVRDSGAYRRRDAGWLEPQQRLTVSHFRNSLEALDLGLAYAWLPEPYVAAHLLNGRLRELRLAEGGRRRVDLHLVFTDRSTAGPATVRLAELLHQHARLL
ncbi:MAG: LysR family transcriptional regulator [Pseudomonadota bacterium]